MKTRENEATLSAQTHECEGKEVKGRAREVSKTRE